MHLKFSSGAVAALALVCAGTPAIAGKGIGPYYSMKYQSHGSSESGRSEDGQVALLEESIESINCGGCDTVWYGPGRLFHLRNLGRAPICARWDFKPAGTGYDLEKFGNGSIHYLKPGKTAAQVGGLFYVSTGQTGSADVGYSGQLRTWAPLGKNSCGSGPS